MCHIALLAFVTKDGYFRDYFIGFVVNLITSMVNHQRTTGTATNFNFYCENYSFVGIDIITKIYYPQSDLKLLKVFPVYLILAGIKGNTFLFYQLEIHTATELEKFAVLCCGFSLQKTPFAHKNRPASRKPSNLSVRETEPFLALFLIGLSYLILFASQNESGIGASIIRKVNK
jgi:hypothetical protein